MFFKCRPQKYFFCQILCRFRQLVNILLEARDIPNVKLCANGNLQFNKKPLLFLSFTMRGVVTIADIWDGTKKDFISNDILLEKLHVHSSSSYEWFTIKTVVRNVYGLFLKHSNGNSNVCNVLALSGLNLYTPNGNLIKPNSKGILSQFKRKWNIHLKTELNWERKLEVNDFD